MHRFIPVIDLFAGPGGLSEGFSRYGEEDWCSITETSLSPQHHRHAIRFEIALSIEKDSFAHSTLELRALTRKLVTTREKVLYRRFLLGELDRDALFSGAGAKAVLARDEAWMAALGEVDETKIDRRIRRALQGHKEWALIGGPPCQAYSLAGRSRNRGVKGYRPENDDRHFLYQEYLRILAKHRPPVFVMENVKGLLSSRVNGDLIFERICADLREPARAVRARDHLTYELHALAGAPLTAAGPNSSQSYPGRFLVRMEEYGIPQCRHRVIILGVRSNVRRSPTILSKGRSVTAGQVLDGLPELRSALSKEPDSAENWRQAIAEVRRSGWLRTVDPVVADAVRTALNSISTRLVNSLGGKTLAVGGTAKYAARWYGHHDLVLNHEARGHLRSDLHRYLFAAAYAEVKGSSPTLEQFPKELLPKHKNAYSAVEFGGNFNDRFRVQVGSRPATTVTSHISKDGHYYIHYDPGQCRSLTVREAARLQTFPDDYFFSGPRTEQYRQVGNAVPPLFAVQIASVVADLLG